MPETPPAASPPVDTAIPPAIITYGDSGFGKTTDTLYSFPNALFIPIHADAVRMCESVCGYRLKPGQVQPQRMISQATGLLTQIAAAQKTSGKLYYPQVVIDDLTLLMAGEEARIDEENLGKKKVDGFEKWRVLKALLQQFCDVARHELGCTVVMNGHKRTASTNEKTGMYYKGGPLLPSKALTSMVPHLATSVYEVGREGSRKPWVGVYQTDTSYEWIRKCRLGYRGTIPMNLAELLRGAGVPVARHPGLVWQEEMIEEVAAMKIAGKTNTEIGKEFIPRLSGKNEMHAAWLLRDGVDRGIIRGLRKTTALASWL